MITVGSLFAGIGGICLAFNNGKSHVVWANEIDPIASKTYRENFNHDLYEGDINDFILKAKKREFTFPQVDILTAGFPCQAFSIAGYQKGFEDDRGNLFFSILEVVKLIRPKALFLENVKNLRSHDKGRTFKIIKNSLLDLGYTFNDFVFNTMTYSNIPQNRERIFMISFDKTDKDLNIERFTEGELGLLLHIDPIPLTKTIHDLIEPEKQDEIYYYKPDSKIYPELKSSMTNRDTIYQWRRVYVRENQNNVCPTLTANMGTGGHNVPLIIDDFGIRKLTPRECARFQGFPDSFKFPKIANSHLYKQIGNSVSIPLIGRLADKMIDILTGEVSLEDNLLLDL